MSFFNYSKESFFPIGLFLLLAIILNCFLYGFYLDNSFLIKSSYLFFVLLILFSFLFLRKYYNFLKEYKFKEIEKNKKVEYENKLKEFPELLYFQEKYSKIIDLLHKKFPNDSIFKNRLSTLIDGFEKLFLDNLEKIKDMKDYASYSSISLDDDIKVLSKENKEILFSLDQLVKQVILSKDIEDKYSELYAALSQNVDLFKKMKGYVHE